MDLSRSKVIILVVVAVFVLLTMSWFHVKFPILLPTKYHIGLSDKTNLQSSIHEDLWYLKDLPASKETFHKILRIESQIFFAHRMYPCPSHALVIGMPLIPKWFQSKMEQFDAIEEKLHTAHHIVQTSTPLDKTPVDWNQPHLLPGNDIKIGYYILCHSSKDLWRVKKLIQAIFVAEHTIIVVHCDLRIHDSPEIFEFRTWLAKEGFAYPYVWLIDTEQSLIGRYGGISVIYVELLCLHALLTSSLGHTLDSFISLTPADFPIKSKQAILNRLFLYRKHSIYNTGWVYPRSFYHRIENYYCHDFGVGYRRGEPLPVAPNNAVLINITGNFLLNTRMTAAEKYVVNIGAGWTILSFESVFYLFRIANRKLLYYWLIYYHSTSCVDEFFFQTIYFIATKPPKMNQHLRYYYNPLNYTVLNGSLHVWDPLGYGDDFANQWRFIRWRGEMSPSLLEEDLPRMKKSSALYARKFDNMSLFKTWTTESGLYSDLTPYEQNEHG